MNRQGWRRDNDDSDPTADNPRSPSPTSRGVPVRRTYNPDDAIDRMSGARGGREYDSGAERDKGGRSGPLASPFGGRTSDRPPTGDRSADRGREADKDNHISQDDGPLYRLRGFEEARRSHGPGAPLGVIF